MLHADSAADVCLGHGMLILLIWWPLMFYWRAHGRQVDWGSAAKEKKGCSRRGKYILAAMVHAGSLKNGCVSKSPREDDYEREEARKLCCDGEQTLLIWHEVRRCFKKWSAALDSLEKRERKAWAKIAFWSVSLLNKSSVCLIDRLRPVSFSFVTLRSLFWFSL